MRTGHLRLRCAMRTKVLRGGGEYMKLQLNAKKCIPRRSTTTERTGNSKNITIKNCRTPLDIPQPSRQSNSVLQSRKRTTCMDLSCSPLAALVSVKTDIICEERRKGSVRGIEKSRKGRTKKKRTYEPGSRQYSRWMSPCYEIHPVLTTRCLLNGNHSINQN